MSADVGARSPVGRERAPFAAHLGGDAVLVCSGELDLMTKEQMEQSILGVLRLAPERLVVDLSGVTFLDASAVRELLRTRDVCRTAGCDLVVRSPSELVRRVLDIVGLTDLVETQAASDAKSGTGPASPEMGEVAAAWEAACLTPRYGEAELVFDPSLVTEAVAALLGDHELTTDPAGSAAISGAVAMRPGASPVLAVLQLWALNDVWHARLDSQRGAGAGHGRPDRRRVSLEAALAGLAASVLAELERSSLVDPLTGLLNRRSLDRDLVRAIAVARRRKQSLTVVMVDVEGLKGTNDRFGHAAGDAVLRGVATSLIAAVRAGDDVYRIGGDEFVLLMPDLSPEDVEAVMRRTAAASPNSFSWGSAGLAEGGEASDAESAAQLLDLADQRMLEKRGLSGRNRRDHQPGGSHPAPSPVRQTAVSGAADEITAGYRARVVVDEAKGMIAAGFDIGIEEASAILRQVSLARGLTVTAVAEGLIGRPSDRCSQPSRASGPTAANRDDVGLAAGGAPADS